MRGVEAAYGCAARALEALNTHRARIERAEAVTENGITGAVFSEIARDVPCTLDAKPSGYNDMGAFAGGELKYVCFFARDADVRAGDRAYVEAGGGEMRYSAGAVVRYKTHTEVTLKREGRA